MHKHNGPSTALHCPGADGIPPLEALQGLGGAGSHTRALFMDKVSVLNDYFGFDLYLHV